MTTPISITLNFSNVREAALAMLRLSHDVAFHVIPNSAGNPASAAETTTEAEATPATKTPAAPAQPAQELLAKAPKIRGRKQEAKTGAAVAPTEPAASDAAPLAAAPVAASPEPVFSLDTPAAPPVAPAAATPSSPPLQQAPAATGGEVPLAKVQTAVEDILGAKGIPATMATLARFGVRRGRDIPEDRRAEFLEYAKGVLAGKIDPTSGSEA